MDLGLAVFFYFPENSILRKRVRMRRLITYLTMISLRVRPGLCARLRPEAAAAAAATVAVRVSPKLKPKPLTGAEGDETLAMFSAPEHDEAAGIQIIRVLMASASRRSQ